LPFETVKSSDGEKANKTWWIDVNDTGDISLVGNGQSAVMIDAKIGAAITGELELFVTPHKFDHPIIHTTEDGGLSVEARGKVFRRRGLGPVKNEAYLVGRTGLLSLSELTDGFK
jgi:hypothetical protein